MGSTLRAISRAKQQSSSNASKAFASQLANRTAPSALPGANANGDVAAVPAAAATSASSSSYSTASSGTSSASTAGNTGSALQQSSSIAGFGVIGSGHSRMNTGSHIDNDTFSLMAGLALSVDFSAGEWLLGRFIEHGEGSYDTYNSFPDAASVHGSGDTDYTGLGLLSRFDFNACTIGSLPASFFIEGSFRAGRIHNDYANGDLVDAAGTVASFENSNTYWNFHVGTGVDLALNDTLMLTLGTQYFYTRQSAAIADLTTGEHM